MHASPAPASTKASELIRLKGTLRRAGLSIPPFSLLLPDCKDEQIARAIARFSRLYRPEGPFEDYAIIRNNGRPTGTGKGESKIIPLWYTSQDRKTRYPGQEPLIPLIRNKISYVLASDPEAQGVLFQAYAGQTFLAEKNSSGYFAPLVSGIAYTSSCTKRGNAVVEWAYGCPSVVVKGRGRYVAFNADTLESEVGKMYLEVGPLEVAGVRGTREPSPWEIRRAMSFFQGLGDEMKRTLFTGLFRSILELGKSGPLYLEWAITQTNSKTRMFALQAAEFERTLAGLPTEMFYELGELKRPKREPIPWNRGTEEFRDLCGIATEDPTVAAFGFDLVGNKTMEFGEMLWLPTFWHRKPANPSEFTHTATTSGLILPTRLLVVDGNQLNSGYFKFFIDTGKLLGIVLWEETSGTSHTFRGHFGQDCSESSALGFSVSRQMEGKLFSKFPAQFDSLKNQTDLLIKGRFILECDESLPFGSLRVLEVTEVQKIEQKL